MQLSLSFTPRDPDVLSVQSFSSASVILNLSELPCPGGFPATFRLSVVPRPWSTMVSITVRLFLHAFPKHPEDKHATVFSEATALWTLVEVWLPDYEKGGDAVVSDGREPHAE